MPTRIILDTDIGTDVDDCLALAVILGSPEVQLAGVTCVYGDVGLRARMVKKLLGLYGLRGIPILRGESEPLLGLRPVYWEGHEGQGLVEPEDETQDESEDAVGFIIRTVLENPGKIQLLAIGPLTNVALAIKREPRVVHDLGGLMIMGGVMRGPTSLDLPYVEHNIRCDPEAAHIVLASGAPITLAIVRAWNNTLARARLVRRGCCGWAATGSATGASRFLTVS